MSLLESFLLSFKTDADKASDDVEGLNKNLDDTGGAAKKAAQGVDVMVKSVAGLLAAYISLDAIRGKIFNQALAVDTVGKFSETLGFNAQMVDAWGASVERNGGSAEGFRATLAGLNDQLKNQAAFGTGDIAQTLSRVGINAFDAQGKLKDTFAVMLELSDVFKDMSKQDSSLIGKKLGLDQGTILLLQQSRYSLENLVEQQRQFGGVTDASYKASAEFNDEMDNSSRIFNSWFQKANTTILPVLTEMSQGFRGMVNWAKDHETLVTGFFIAMGGAVLSYALPPMLLLAGSVLAATAPFIAIGAAIAAVSIGFAILYEDVAAYLGGQESFIGDLAKKYEWFGGVVDSVIGGIKYTFDQLEKDLDWIKLLFTNPMEAIEKLKQGFIDLFGFVGDLFGDMDLFGGSSAGPISNSQKGMAIQQEYASSPINSMGGSSFFNTSAIQKSVNISMGGVNVDARGMSAAEARTTFSDSLKGELANAMGQFDDGVDR